MCTVTLVPYRDATGAAARRLACNRDEQRSRPSAFPPRVRRFGDRWAVLPTDPVSGGTWVAANDAGLAFALLNVNPPHPRAGNVSRGRGQIIPALLPCGSRREAARLAAALRPEEYPPFRLVIADRDEWAEVYSDGECLRVRRGHGAMMVTSSGLGDHLVEGPRRRLWEATAAAAGDERERQADFHRHSWPDRTHLSVCMRRPDARTVSYTSIDLRPDSATLTYLPDAPDRPAEPVALPLDLLTLGAV